MDKTNIKLKILKNKKNNQLVVCLNRKQFGLKDKSPKFLKINKGNFEF